MPPVALGREWSGRRLKEISGGLKTAHAESKKKVGGDFPGRPVVRNLLGNAEDRGSITGWETKIPHAMEQLSQLATITEPICHN